jgi:peptidylprolyl isomerase
MKTKDILTVVIFIGVLVGMWFFIRMGEAGPTTLDDKSNAYSTDDKIDLSNITDTQKVDNTKDTINNNLKKSMQATINTNQGNIVIELFGDKTPNTVANFTKLASEGFYNGTKFHRVIKGFMIQGGDPLTKDDSKMDMWGTGGPGYKFADEIGAENKNDIGTISMANAGPNTNGSQFFINVAPNNFLDGKHTVFGKVISGMDVVKTIEATPTGTADRPLSPMVINSISIK